MESETRLKPVFDKLDEYVMEITLTIPGFGAKTFHAPIDGQTARGIYSWPPS